jgi:hypothetical protein
MIFAEGRKLLQCNGGVAVEVRDDDPEPPSRSPAELKARKTRCPINHPATYRCYFKLTA